MSEQIHFSASDIRFICNALEAKTYGYAETEVSAIIRKIKLLEGAVCISKLESGLGDK